MASLTYPTTADRMRSGWSWVEPAMIKVYPLPIFIGMVRSMPFCALAVGEQKEKDCG